ncbi:SCO family protein [Peribacillus cavernae]|uniref:SCO family protein n=1 Tax=Peribacillus cavernae TaxID=1674310 RepID=A0A3S0W212_9BACI|nr:SCO family protein [Peribacillus cavernae]MDQ0221443.1 protein SCO1/2 [Peribacillus cavernae]RUQ23964.1 SCO family protein [Peribacillus cavernae]
MRNITIILSVLLLFGLLIYWLFPKKEALPVLKNISSFEMENVHDGTYRFDKGKVRLVTFFYTNCPDVCPSTMTDLKQLQEQFKNQEIFASEAELISITLDPEFDNKEIIQKYASAFQADPDGWKWLRDTPAETKSIAAKFQMNYKKTEDGFVAHNTTMYLVDENNQIRATYDMANPSKPVDREKILKDIHQLLK